MGKVIPGWDQGCLGMQLGEVRELCIPADEGYGQGGFPAWAFGEPSCSRLKCSIYKGNLMDD